MVQRRYVHPWQQWIDQNGDPALGWKLYFYQTGTTTPLATYEDQGLTIPHDNPVIAEDDGGSSSGGVWPVIFMQAQVYKVVLKDENDVTILTQDPYDPTAAGVPTSAVITYDIIVKVGADGGDPLSTGIADDFRHKVTGTITGWTVINDQSGSIAWYIRRKAYVQDSAPAGGDSIVASAPPNTSSHRSETNTTLTGWTTAFTTGDWWEFGLTTVDGVITRSTLSLHCTRTITLS